MVDRERKACSLGRVGKETKECVMDNMVKAVVKRKKIAWKEMFGNKIMMQKKDVLKFIKNEIERLKGGHIRAKRREVNELFGRKLSQVM